LNFKLRDSPFGDSEKYQPAYGNKLALLERRRQAGYEPTSQAILPDGIKLGMDLACNDNCGEAFLKEVQKDV
jgi:hypothetical protein